MRLLQFRISCHIQSVSRFNVSSLENLKSDIHAVLCKKIVSSLQRWTVKRMVSFNQHQRIKHIKQNSSNPHNRLAQSLQTSLTLKIVMPHPNATFHSHPSHNSTRS